LKKVARGYLIIGAASFNNSLGLIKSGPDVFVEFSTFRTSSTSFSHNLISLIWFAACGKLGILLLESSISDCFEKYLLNKFAFSIS
jgi:hypothetical protein